MTDAPSKRETGQLQARRAPGAGSAGPGRRPDAHLFEQRAARTLVRDQLDQQFGQSHATPPHRLFQRVGDRVVRLGPAEEFGLAALNRALEGVTGTTAVHICFGYAAIIHQRPSAYSFLKQLKDCRCNQISIETAQSNLDCSVLKDLPDQKIILGVLDLSRHEVETPETVAVRIRRGLAYRKAEDIIVAPDCGLKYLPRDSAFGKMKAMVEGAQIVRAELR